MQNESNDSITKCLAALRDPNFYLTSVFIAYLCKISTANIRSKFCNIDNRCIFKLYR